jgi:3D (Asp-Asp-Asp) domain-containing protein
MCLILLLTGCLVYAPQSVFLLPKPQPKPVVRVATQPSTKKRISINIVPPRERETYNYGKNRVRLTRVSAYNAHPSQTDSTPNIAACGRIRANMIAVSRDIFQRGRRCGQWVTVVLRSGQRIRAVIWDTMNARYRNAADILLYSSRDARRFGVQRGWLEF